MTTHADATRPDDGLRQSRIGKRPIALPKGVNATLKDGSIELKGPKGTLSRMLPERERQRSTRARSHITPTIPGRDGARFQGLARALFGGMVDGRRRGLHEDAAARRHWLSRRGQGPDAEPRARLLAPHCVPAAQGRQVRDPGDSKGTIVILTGSDKETMGQTAAKIRGLPSAGALRRQGRSLPGREGSREGRQGREGRRRARSDMAMRIVGTRAQEAAHPSENQRDLGAAAPQRVPEREAHLRAGRRRRQRFHAGTRVHTVTRRAGRRHRGQQADAAKKVGQAIAKLCSRRASARSSSTETATSTTGASARWPTPRARPA